MTEPLPVPTSWPSLETQPYFDAASEGRLSLPRCDDCDFVIWYPRTRCPECGSNNTSWFDASGKGTVYTATVVRKGLGRWRESSPYVLAYIELEEGPRVLTNVIDCDPDAVTIGSSVTAVFVDAKEGPPLLRFTLNS